jgi:hypothetical protein
MQNLPSSTLFNIARAGRWLFWTSLAYTAIRMLAIILTWGLGGRNYQPRDDAWAYFKWHFPAVFEGMSIIAPLIPLYLFQFHLNAGCKQTDPERTGKGLQYLFTYLATLAFVYGLKLVFEYGIEYIW